jgi:hypothetical protein
VCVHDVDVLPGERAAQRADGTGVLRAGVGRDLDRDERGTGSGEVELLLGGRRPAHQHPASAGDETADQ